MNSQSNITGGVAAPIFTARVMGKYDVRYYRCAETGYIQTEAPYWLKEAYASPMNLTDTGILARNLSFFPVIGSFLFCFYPLASKFLDYAGGYGVFTRIMRDVGFDYYWDDPFTQNLMARGFEATPGAGPFAAMTALEVFEHLPNPVAELGKMQALAPDIIFSTQLLPEAAPSRDWAYFAFEHGQHVSFYTAKALDVLAGKIGALLVSNQRDLHAFLSEDTLPLRIAGSWYRRWLKTLPVGTATAVAAAYAFEPQRASGGTWKQWLKSAYHRKQFPGWYQLKPAIDPATRDALRASGLTVSYGSHLLSAGSIYWGDMAARMKSKTVDDMYFLKSKMPA